jgi:hypothetical protein
MLNSILISGQTNEFHKGRWRRLTMPYVRRRDYVELIALRYTCSEDDLLLDVVEV